MLFKLLVFDDEEEEFLFLFHGRTFLIQGSINCGICSFLSVICCSVFCLQLRLTGKKSALLSTFMLLYHFYLFGPGLSRSVTKNRKLNCRHWGGFQYCSHSWCCESVLFLCVLFEPGFVGANTFHKTISTTFFLYFACILPAIALGVLNSNNTRNAIS